MELSRASSLGASHVVSFTAVDTLPPTERDAQERPGKRPVGGEGRTVHLAGSVSFSPSLTCQAMFLEPGSGHGASG